MSAWLWLGLYLLVGVVVMCLYFRFGPLDESEGEAMINGLLWGLLWPFEIIALPFYLSFYLLQFPIKELCLAIRQRRYRG